jgi:hypothetical protein
MVLEIVADCFVFDLAGNTGFLKDSRIANA